MADPTYIRTDRAAAILACSAITVRRLCRRGEIQAVRVGREWRIPFANLAAATLRGDRQ